MTISRALRPAAVALVLAASALPAAAESPASAPLAKELVQEMSRQQLTAIAAKDPEQPDVYIAATYIPGVQLLAVSARSTAPAYLDQALAGKRYDEVYASLHGASLPDGKLFVQDMRADGVTPDRVEGGSFDIVYEDTAKTVMFNGEWKKQHMSEADYRGEYGKVDARYARILSLLLQHARAGSQGTSR